VVVEIVRPGTGDPVPEGEVGEVLVTTFDQHYPLVRFATGDLSAFMPGTSPCGRTNRRIRGWMGRADQAAKVRGMFVRPEQVAEILRAHPEVSRARLVVTLAGERDEMVLRAEAPDPAIAESLARTLQSVTRLRGAVEVVPLGTLPNDGKVVDDQRPT
jgi:phenylacetate-CoA ligase